MNSVCRAAIAAVMLAVGASCSSMSSRPSEASVTAHLDEATRAAGADLKPLLVLCKPAPAARPPQNEVDKGIATQIARPAPEPGRAFDNLYFVGAAWVSAWALKTSDGIILIDALNNAREAAELIEAGMRKVGLNPADIRYIVVTHAHGDHYGGVNYLVERYRPRVVMSEPNWKIAETGLEFESAHWGPFPKRDVSIRDGDVLTLGDTKVALYLTPGHTMGTISPVFNVTSGGKSHRVMLWGGTAFNFGKDIPRLDGYIGATQRMMRLAREQGVDVLLSNHAGYDQSIEKLSARRKDPAGEPNPFVMGTPAVQRALTVMGECAMATRDRFMMSAGLEAPQFAAAEHSHSHSH